MRSSAGAAFALGQEQLFGDVEDDRRGCGIVSGQIHSDGGSNGQQGKEDLEETVSSTGLMRVEGMTKVQN